MDDHQRVAVPDEFVEEVKRILENLYDYPFLQRHPLAQQVAQAARRPRESVAVHLRRAVIDAIEMLSPGPDVPFRAPHARLYNLLHLRYIDGVTIQEAACELGISERQTYRDLRRGEESVADILWAKVNASPPPQSAAPGRSELNHIDRQLQSTDLRALLEHAHNAVNQLAHQYHVQVALTLAPEPVITTTEPMLAQQILVGLMSKIIQELRPGSVEIALVNAQDRVVLDIRCHHATRAQANPVLLDALITQLLERLGWTLMQHSQPYTIRLQIPTLSPTILVIDDNEGLVELVRRILADQVGHVLAANTGHEGLEKARTHHPDAIILDVMMPGMDGWEVLQTLKTNAQTSDIPVVVCSVFNDPGLALSLGAAKFLSKPINRECILDAMHELNVF